MIREREFFEDPENRLWVAAEGSMTGNGRLGSVRGFAKLGCGIILCQQGSSVWSSSCQIWSDVEKDHS